MFRRFLFVLAVMMLLSGLLYTPRIVRADKPFGDSPLVYTSAQLFEGTAFLYFPLDLSYIGVVTDTTFTYDVLPAMDFVQGDITRVYALDLDVTNSAHLLLSIDTATGVTTTIGAAVPPPGASGWTGAAWSDSAGRFYAISNYDTLSWIDLSTGAPTTIGQISDEHCIMDLAAHPTANTLYAIDACTNSLISINPTTAVPTVIGPIGFDASITLWRQALDFNDATGELYYISLAQGSQVTRLRTLNLSTGTASPGTELDSNEVQYCGLAIAAVPPTAISLGSFEADSVFPNTAVIMGLLVLGATLLWRFKRDTSTLP